MADDSWPDPEFVEIAKLALSDELFARERLDEETIAEYAEAMQEEDQRFPAIRVIRPPSGPFWVVDGWHRVEAARRAGYTKMRASIRPGKWNDAILAAVSSNVRHGLRRTNADKRRVVAMLLDLPEWSEASDREVTRRCGVHHELVGDVRRAFRGVAESAACDEPLENIEDDPPRFQEPDLRRGADGKVYDVSRAASAKGRRKERDRMVESTDPWPEPPPHISQPEENGKILSPSSEPWGSRGG